MRAACRAGPTSTTSSRPRACIAESTCRTSGVVLFPERADAAAARISVFGARRRRPRRGAAHGAARSAACSSKYASCSPRSEPTPRRAHWPWTSIRRRACAGCFPSCRSRSRPRSTRRTGWRTTTPTRTTCTSTRSSGGAARSAPRGRSPGPSSAFRLCERTGGAGACSSSTASASFRLWRSTTAPTGGRSTIGLYEAETATPIHETTRDFEPGQLHRVRIPGDEIAASAGSARLGRIGMSPLLTDNGKPYVIMRYGDGPLSIHHG